MSISSKILPVNIMAVTNVVTVLIMKYMLVDGIRFQGVGVGVGSGGGDESRNRIK